MHGKKEIHKITKSERGHKERRNCVTLHNPISASILERSRDAVDPVVEDVLKVLHIFCYRLSNNIVPQNTNATLR
jgi:hypothetical protein